MSKHADGGPAFPTLWRNESDLNQTAPDGTVCPPGFELRLQGIPLRDYFAAKALQGLIAEPISEGHYSTAYVIGGGNMDPADNFARAAYALADAMLKARQQ